MQAPTQHDRVRVAWQTPIGPMTGKVCEAGWLELRFPPANRLRVPAAPGGEIVRVAIECETTGEPAMPSPRMQSHLQEMQEFLAAVFAGRRPGAKPAIAVAGRTPFERAVYREMLALDFGATTTYGELARRSGRPGAARAIGGVMKRNPLPLLLPCHRVLAAGGGAASRIGGFTPGVELKHWLLKLEGSAAGENPCKHSPNGSSRSSKLLELNN